MASILQDCLAGLNAAWRTSGFPVIVIGTTAVADRIPAGVLACFKTEFVMEAPNEQERFAILRSLVKRDHLAPDVALRNVAVQTAALVASDLVDLVSRTRARALQRAQETACVPASGVYPNRRIETRHSLDVAMANLQHAGIALTADDFASALDKARASYSESIGAPKIPNVTWDDVGGLANIKSEILDTIQLPLERPELFADGLKKRSGAVASALS
jgi:peroxin-6